MAIPAPAAALWPAPPPAVPLTGKAALATGHLLFIGEPAEFARLDCEGFESASAPHRSPPRPLHDATVTPARHRTDFEIIEVLQGPAAPPAASRQPGDAPKAEASVYLALSPSAFTTDHHERLRHAYDGAYCRRLNKVFTAPFVVVHAYPIHVDRGNRGPDPLEGVWRSLGTDPSKPSAGFQTVEEARDYATTLLSRGAVPAR